MKQPLIDNYFRKIKQRNAFDDLAAGELTADEKSIYHYLISTDSILGALGIDVWQEFEAKGFLPPDHNAESFLLHFKTKLLSRYKALTMEERPRQQFEILQQILRSPVADDFYSSVQRRSPTTQRKSQTNVSQVTLERAIGIPGAEETRKRPRERDDDSSPEKSSDESSSKKICADKWKPYTPEEDRGLILALIHSELIRDASIITTWEKLIQRGHCEGIDRSAGSMFIRFMTNLRWTYRRIIDDPVVIREFEKAEKMRRERNKSKKWNKNWSIFG